MTKEYLRKYRMLIEELETEEERLEAMNINLPGTSGGGNDGMPSGSGDKDPIGTQYCIKAELEKKVIRIKERELKERMLIEEKMEEKMLHPRERQIIRMHYIDRMEWKQINKALYGKNSNFYEKEESYMKKIFRIHGAALQKLKEGEWNPNEEKRETLR